METHFHTFDTLGTDGRSKPSVVPVTTSPFTELGEAWARIERVAEQVEDLASRFVGAPTTGQGGKENPRLFDGLVGNVESAARGLQQQADRMEESLYRIRKALP